MRSGCFAWTKDPADRVPCATCRVPILNTFIVPGMEPWYIVQFGCSVSREDLPENWILAAEVTDRLDALCRNCGTGVGPDHTRLSTDD